MAICNYNLAKSILSELADNSEEFYKNGVSYECIVFGENAGEFSNIAVGETDEIVKMLCVAIVNVWINNQKYLPCKTFDEFANSLPGYIKYVHNHWGGKTTPHRAD